jgi:hypothetical protein
MTTHTVRLDIITTIEQHRRDIITIIITDRRHLTIIIRIMVIAIDLTISSDLIAISHSDHLRRIVIMDLPQREIVDNKSKK